MMKYFLIFLLVLSVSCGSPKDANQITENEILWDTWGIPHIYATDDTNLYEMLGWAQMKNHGNVILKLYGESRGKANEYWGGDFEMDKSLHQLDLVNLGKKMYQSSKPEIKTIIDAFANGLNAYASKNPELLDKKYTPVLPIKPEDVTIHISRVLYYEFLIKGNLVQGNNWIPQGGSNAWAVNGNKTTTGNSMLLANPHLPWSDFYLFFEAQLITNSNTLYGATLAGFPLLAFGFNDHLGWTLTVNVLDNVDLYEIETKNGQYLIDGTYRDFELETFSLMKQNNDSVEKIELERKKSTFGFIIKEEGNKALAIRYPNMNGSMNPAEQWRAMGLSQSLESFKDALRINTSPFCNIIYGDKDGNILYSFGGHIPKKQGDWEKWKRVVATNSSNEIWNSYYSFDELPYFVNPAENWLQNANDPPYTSTIPPTLLPTQYPSHITTNYMGFRPQRSAKLMKEAPKMSLDDFITLKHDTKSELALRIKDDIQALTSLTKDTLVLEAITMLSHWNAAFDAESEEALFFYTLMNKINESEMFEDKWNFQNPMLTPDGFKNPEQIVNTIKTTAEEMLLKYGSIRKPYGDVFRVKAGKYEFPGNGGSGNLGLFRTMHFVPDGNGKHFAYHGDSFVCAISFDDEIKAKALVAYGNATQPNSPHVGDQLKLYADKKLRDVWLHREDHDKNLELVEKLSDMK